MTFTDYYQRLPKPETAPKTAFVERIAQITDSSEQAVHLWIAGKRKPHPSKWSAIEKEMGLPIDVLFPGIKDND